jgi:two-component system, chemotaxis family, sensor kinase Cph1
MMMIKSNRRIEPKIKLYTQSHPKEAAMAKVYYIYERRADSANRDKEQGRVPGLIQPHGALIVIGEPELRILRVSANTESHFGFAPEELLDQPLAQLLGEAEVDRLCDKFLLKNLDAAPHYLPPAQIGSKENVFELSLHRSQGLLILECERNPDGDIPPLNFHSAANSAIMRMLRAESEIEACQAAAVEMRWLTGFDRAMIYRFNEDDSCDVIAESLGGDFESYLGLHCSASDIRRQARALAPKPWLRVVVDVNSQSCPLVPAAASAPLDLSYAVTRSLAAERLKHLSRLGVTASMFIPIINNDLLWGLIALHHHTGPKYVPHNARVACERMARFLSTQTSLKECADANVYSISFERISRSN